MSTEQALAAEARRIIDALPTMTIGSEQYMATVSCLERLLGIKQFAAEVLDQSETPPIQFLNLQPVEESAPAPAPVEESKVELTPVEEPTPFEAPAVFTKTYTKEEVRAALGEARRNGVNIVEILRGFGVDNFSSFPAARYAELMEKLG